MSLKSLILLLFFFIGFLFLFKTPNVYAAAIEYCGKGGCFTYDPVTRDSNCERLTGPSEITNSDPLSPCVRELGSYQNTCCRTPGGCTAAGDGSALKQWDWNYATACIATKDPTFETCDFQFKYQTVTCQSTDTCRAEPYLYPGLCTDTGCAISPTKYKVCCATNAVGGVCEGGNYSGTCPNGTEEKFCGFGNYPACNSPVVCGTPTAPPPPQPSPSQAPPPPGAPSLSSFGGAGCFVNGYVANISWSGTPLPSGDACPNGFWVDISTSSNFSSGKYHKCVSGTSTSAPSGFNGYEGTSGALNLAKGTTYYARVFNGTHSNTVSMTVPTQDCDGPTGNPDCGTEVAGSLTSPGFNSDSPVTFSGTYYCQPGQCVGNDFGFTADPANSYVSINGTRHYFGSSDPSTSSGVGGGTFRKQITLAPGSYDVMVWIEGNSQQLGNTRPWFTVAPGNICNGPGRLTVAGDTQAPVCGYLHLNGSAANTVRVKQGDPVRIDFSVNDNVEVGTVEIFRGANKIDTFNNTLHTKPAFQVSNYTYSTAGLTPGTYNLVTRAVDTSGNQMSTSDTQCQKQLVVDTSTWVPPTCTNGVFAGCKIQGGADCSDAGPGTPQYSNWTPSLQQMCARACATPNTTTSRNQFCGQDSLSVIPKSISKVGGNWEQISIRPIMGTVSSGNILYKFGAQTTTGTCTGTLCQGWSVARNGIANTTSSFNWTAPQGMTPGTYTFALFRPDNSAILAVDTADFLMTCNPLEQRATCTTNACTLP